MRGRMMKALSLRAVAGIALALLPITLGCGKPKQPRVLVAVNQYVEHPNLDAVFDGFKVELDAWGEKHGTQVQYDHQVAGANPSAAQQIVRQQVAKNPRLILALATPSAQAAARATNSIPIVFGAITDPVSAGLVKSPERPDGNVTGTSDIGPYDRQFELIRKLTPKGERVGIIRNPGEVNSVASMKIIDPAIRKWGFRKVEVAVSSTSEVVAAARSLVGRCDVFYIPADNTVLSSLPAVANVANARKIPLFVGDEGSLKLGGAVTIGIDYYQLGRATGAIACKILDGAKPGSIPVVAGKGTQLMINPKAVALQGIKIPPDILKVAKVVR
jgi:putative tryptophan/tyrosine transport system substrate-binding protein